MISERVRLARDGCQEAMIGCPGLWIQSLGRIDGCPSVVDGVVGVEWWEDFQEEESEELLPVLHLGSHWPGSSVSPPYMRWARPNPCAIEAPLNAVRLCLLDHPVEQVEWVSAGLVAGHHAWLHSLWAVRMSG